MGMSTEDTFEDLALRHVQRAPKNVVLHESNLSIVVLVCTLSQAAASSRKSYGSQLQDPAAKHILCLLYFTTDIGPVIKWKDRDKR
jgi:hypothetical protein